MALYQLPMLECSSCGQIVGHMYEDYYRLSEQLMKELKEQPEQIPRGDYQALSDLNPFIKTYYAWYLKNKETALEYYPCNIIARALLQTCVLVEGHLPFGSKREEDNQLSYFEPKICCLRMLETDPMMTKI